NWIHMLSSSHIVGRNERNLLEVAAAAQPGNLPLQNSELAGFGIYTQVGVSLAQGRLRDAVGLADQGFQLAVQFNDPTAGIAGAGRLAGGTGGVGAGC